MNISGNTVLITGGSSGIGLEFATQLAQLGNTVIITGRDKAKLAEVTARWPALQALCCDVGEDGAIGRLYAQVVAEHPSLNIVINNAGIMRKLNLHEFGGQDGDDLVREIDTNLIAPIRLVAHFLPHLKRQRQAAIVNVSSGLAFVPMPISPIYCAAKAGLHSYTQSLRVQLKNTAVKVFELAPPLTETPLLGAFSASDAEGGKPMPVAVLIAAAIKGMAADTLEIRPGMSNALKLMSRYAPRFIFRMLSKPVDAMLAQTAAQYDALSHQAAVGAQRLAIDPAAVGTDEKGDGGGDVVRCAEPFERRGLAEALDDFLAFTVQEQRGGGRAGRDGVDADVLAAQFLRKDIRHRFDGRLGGAIDRIAGQRQTDHARGKIDDASARAQTRRRFAHRVETAFDVHGKQLVEGGVVGIGQRRQAGRHHARVVDQDIDGAEGRFGCIEQCLDRRRIGDVGLHGDGLAAGGRDRVHHGVGVFLFARVIDDDAQAVGGEPPGDGRADAARGARDDGDFVVDIGAHTNSCLSRWRPVQEPVEALWPCRLIG
jgi:uncharacterized oxidoreductase